MSKLRVRILAGVGALAIAGTSFAATLKNHVMNVPLPEGSAARVEYVGDVAPKVTIAARALPDGDWMRMALPSFAGFDRMIEQMNRETEAMIRQAHQMAHQPAGGIATPYIASYGNMPAGVTSMTIVSYSNGGRTCTRTTETVSQGADKPPKVISSATGDCGPAPAAPSAAKPGNPA